MYYLKYNGIDLTQLVKVREVSLPSLPSIEHSEIEMWEMDGNIFNSLSYGNKEIEISAIIQPLNPNDLEVYVNDVKRAFFVREPQPLFLGDETRYLLATTEGEVTIAELGKGTCELNVKLIAYYPYWIDKEVQQKSFDGKSGTVTNNGDVPTTPVISVGLEGNTTFVQLEKKSTKERILIGEYPRINKTTIKANNNVLFDTCQTVSGWTSSSASLDAGCGIGGSLSVTNTGGGLCLGSVPSGSSTWKGASYRKSLSSAVKNFKVRANFSFNSTGDNGDPTKIITYNDDLANATSGSVSYTYTVKVKTSLNVRTGPSTSYKRIGSYKNGTKLTGTPTGGWLKHTYNGQTAYCSMQYLTTTATDNRSTSTICNFVTNKATAVRSGADEWSSSKITIPSGTVIRCYVNEIKKKEGETEVATGFRRLHVAYQGHSGYVKISDMTRASEATQTISYEAVGERADDKEGIIQLYGFSSNGIQLFSLSVIDDSEYYEATYPLIKKNGKDFLFDQKFNEPEPKTRANESGSTIKYENILSGKLGDWNEFEGELYIERVDNVWQAYVKKFNGKMIKSPITIDNTNANESLSYLIIYAGVANGDKMSCMSINEIQVQTATAIEPATQNIQRFETGDVLEIDCGVPCVRLNGIERNDLVDIGSQFFDLEVGQNDITIVSDANANFGVLYNEKYL